MIASSCDTNKNPQAMARSRRSKSKGRRNSLESHLKSPGPPDGEAEESKGENEVEPGDDGHVSGEEEVPMNDVPRDDDMATETGAGLFDEPIDALESALRICKLTSWQIGAIKLQGFTDLSTMGYWTTSKDVKTVVSAINKSTADDTKRIHFVSNKSLTGLFHWCQTQHKMGKDPDMEEFTRETLLSSIHELHCAEDNIEISFDEKFDSTKWVTWSRGFTDWLWSLVGVNEIPLAYVIVDKRPKVPPSPLPPQYELVYGAQRKGTAWSRDNAKVFSLLQQFLTVKNGGWAWISEFRKSKNGRGAWQSLVKHYEGASQASNRIEYAKRLLKTKYVSEKKLPFERMVTRFEEGFQLLAEHDRPKSEDEKVDILIRCMPVSFNNQTSNLIFWKSGLVEKGIPFTFREAVTRMAAWINVLVGQNDAAGPDARNIKATTVDWSSNPGKNFSATEVQQLKESGEWEKVVEARKAYSKKKKKKKTKSTKESRKAAAIKQRKKKKKKRKRDDSDDDSVNSHSDDDESKDDEPSSGSNFGSGAYSRKKKKSRRDDDDE